jgi:hypothetical protein
MNLDDIIQTVNTGDFKELDLWDKLVQYFVQVLLMEETGVPREHNRPAASH